MKTMRALFLLVVFAAVSAAAAWGFEHPGARDSRQELDFVKAQIGAGAQPWAGEFDRLKRSSLATRKPHALTTIDSTSKDDAISRDDAAAAYTQALLWYYSGEETYARGAIAILNAWAGLRGFTGGSDQDRLQAGWIGAVFAPAAEIMRLYDGWSHDDIAALQAMFRRAFYPQLNPASTWNGNVDLTQIDALMAIAVFNEDRALFALGLERFRARVPAYFYLRSDGARPRGIAGDGGDVEARSNMAVAALHSGLALANAGLGAVHGFAAPLGGKYGIAHGVVCAALLPAVWEINLRTLQETGEATRRVRRFTKVARWFTGNRDARAEDGVQWLKELRATLNIPGLSELGVNPSDYAELIPLAQRASSMKANPVVLEAEQLRECLELAG